MEEGGDEEAVEVGKEAGRLRVVPRWLSSDWGPRTLYEGESPVSPEVQEWLVSDRGEMMP